MPLNEFIVQIDRAETLGPILDPTKWVEMNKNIAQLKELAKALMLFKRAIDKVREEIEA